MELQTYQELINQGNQSLQNDIQEPIKYYAQEMDLIEDKFETYILTVKAHMINKDKPSAMNAVTQALNYIYKNVDRLQQIVSEYTEHYLDLIPKYVNGLIKEINPEHDYTSLSTYDDYYQLINEFNYYGQIKYAQANLFEKLIELSEWKGSTLIHCGCLALNGIKKQQNSTFKGHYQCLMRNRMTQ